MRRTITLALLLILSLPVLSPLFGVSPDDSALPACCRRDGHHHCAMLSMQTSSGSNSDTRHFSSLQARCPYFPSSVQSFISHTDPPQLIATTVLPVPAGLALAIAETEAHYRISSERARHKRGPPVMLSSLL